MTKTPKPSLADTHPQVAAQAFGWDSSTVTSGSMNKRAWICSSSHVTETRIADKCKGIKCAICSGRQVLEGFNDLKTLKPEIAIEADGWDPVLDPVCWSTCYEANTLFSVRHLVAYSIGVRYESALCGR